MRKYAFIIIFSLVNFNVRANSLEFGEYLFSKGLYREAILEFKRFGFFNKTSTHAHYGLYKIGLSYAQLNNFSQAHFYLEEVIAREPENSPLRAKALLEKAKLFLKEGNYRLAEFELDEVIETSPFIFKEEAKYFKAWLFLTCFNWSAARRVLKELKGSKYQKEALALVKEIETALPLPLKSPRLASLLSAFLPGSGQIYSGEIKKGIISFFLNATLSYLVIKTFLEKDYLGSFLVATLGLWRYYQGSKYHAQRAARAFNTRIKKKLFQNLKSKYQPRLPTPKL
jgi:tetratricopeptide (TPR) repeat protein